MKFLADFYDEDVNFRDFPKITEAISNFKQEMKRSNASSLDVKILKIFQTSRQRTYIVVKGNYVFCVLDDARTDKPKVAWATPKNKLYKDGKLLFKLNPRDKTEKTGLVDLGNQHRDWLYSKNLFKNNELKDRLKETFDKMA
jgi:hypothetical protein